MKKRTANTFIKGLNTDRHPLSSANDELVDAKNTDITAVSKGYQFILQKREGNDIVTKQIANSGTWNQGTTYASGVYILYLGTVYKSLQDTNKGHTPVVSSTWWEAQPEVSAGLPDGYIPLALQEFNNVAYIISVNPTTGKTQLGTFPCPDYAQFVYVSGSPIAGAVGTISHEYKEDQDQVDFAFTTNSSSYPTAALVTPVYSTSSTLYATIPGPSVTLTNTGLNNITININLPADIKAVYSGSRITSITIPTGESRTITFTLENSFLAYDAEEVNSVIVTFSNENVSYTKTYAFSFKTVPTIMAVDDLGNYCSGSIEFRYMNTESAQATSGAITIARDGTAQTTYIQNFTTASMTSSISYTNKTEWDTYLSTPYYNMGGGAIDCTIVATTTPIPVSEGATVVFAHKTSSGSDYAFSLVLYVDALT